MKLLQNKSTGEIGCLVCSFGKTPERITVVEYIDGRRGSKVWYYDSLAELNKEWEDYEEPKEYWYIDTCEGCEIRRTEEGFGLTDKENKEIGNYFETEEEAEKAVEKLKAVKRLKDKGFRFTGITPNRRYIKYNPDEIIPKYGICYDKAIQFEDDLDLLFGGEE